MVAQPTRLNVLWSFTRPNLPTMSLGLLLALVGSAAGLASPMVTKWVLDALDTSSSMFGPLLALVVLLVVGSVISLWQWILLGSLAERIVLEARSGMVKRFLGARVGEITGQPAGELVTRVTSDTLLLRQAASSSLVGLINGVIMLVGSLILMGILDLKLLGVTVAAVVVVVVLFILLMPGIAKAQEATQESVAQLGGNLESALRAIRTVKASRAESRQSTTIIANAEDAAAHSIRSVKREALAWVIAWSGIQLAIIVILGFGAWQVSRDELAVSSLIAFLLYAFGLMGPIMEISQNMTALQSGIAAAGRIQQINELPQESDATISPFIDGQKSADLTSESAPPVLEFRHVSATYGADLDPAVRDISLAIPRRGHVAIVGPSGAGKTTLFSLMLRFIEPESGSILVDGRPYTSLTHHDIRGHFAYVEQETPIVPGTIRDNLLFTNPNATEARIWQVLREVRLEEKVLSLPAGLDTSLNTSDVSGGQRQRIALARAILGSPEILLLDEATAQVDGITEAAIQHMIHSRSQENAVITVAHRLSTVIDADRILVMEDGTIRAQGTHQELLATDELYRELVAALRIQEREPAPQAQLVHA